MSVLDPPYEKFLGNKLLADGSRYFFAFRLVLVYSKFHYF